MRLELGGSGLPSSKPNHTTLCIEVSDGRAPGFMARPTALRLAACTPGNPDQMWELARDDFNGLTKKEIADHQRSGRRALF